MYSIQFSSQQQVQVQVCGHHIDIFQTFNYSSTTLFIVKGKGKGNLCTKLCIYSKIQTHNIIIVDLIAIATRLLFCLSVCLSGSCPLQSCNVPIQFVDCLSLQFTVASLQ